MKKFQTGRLSVAVLFCMAACTSAKATEVRLVIGESYYSRASDINSAGDIVGGSSNTLLPGVGTIWSGSSITNLGALPGFRTAVGTALNDNGVAVGVSHTSDGSYTTTQRPNPTQATLWNGATPTKLATLSGYDSSAAYAINASGVVVGQSYANNNASVATQIVTENRASRATMWQNDAAIALQNLTGANGSSANAINNSGQVVGVSYMSDGSNQATVWSDGLVKSLGNLTGYTNSRAVDINNTGTAVGYTTAADGTTIATVWRDGTPTALEDLGSTSSSMAQAINDEGWIVGTSLGGATLWANGRTINLNTLLSAEQINAGLTLLSATGINNQGVITGMAGDHWGIKWGFVMSGIPEPATWSIFALGLIGLAGAVRANKRAH